MTRFSRWLVGSTLGAGLIVVALLVLCWFYRPATIEYAYSDHVITGESSRVVFFHIGWLRIAIAAVLVFVAIVVWLRLRTRNRERRTGT